MAITRRQALIGTATGAAGLAGLSAATRAQALTEIRISHQWRQQTDARDRGARMFAEEVRKRAPELRFRIYPNRSLIANPIAQFDAMLAGSLEMAVFPITYGVGKVPEFSIGIMPGTVKSVDQAMRLKGSAFHKRFQEVAMEGGIRLVTWWWTPGGFASRERPITGPDSVQGMRMRAADPTFELMLKEAGASVVSMPSTEIYPAMQSGVLNATLTSAETFVSMRIYEQTRHATIGGPNTLWMLLQPLVISTQAWRQLTPAQQRAFDEAADVVDAWFAKEQEEAAEKAVEAFRKANNEVRGLTDQEYAQWVALARRTAWAEFARSTRHGKELLDLLTQSLSS
jgi:TRAP-type C4-dicarboxylate transport system substrate-binding protein